MVKYTKTYKHLKTKFDITVTLFHDGCWTMENDYNYTSNKANLRDSVVECEQYIRGIIDLSVSDNRETLMDLGFEEEYS